MAAIDALLKDHALDKGGSDLHLTVGLPAKSRISGSLQAIGTSRSPRRTWKPSSRRSRRERWKDFLEKKDLDLAHEVEGLARFRANFLYNHWGQAAVMRQIPAKILSFSQPQPARGAEEALPLDQGSSSSTGPTGSGKSTRSRR